MYFSKFFYYLPHLLSEVHIILCNTLEAQDIGSRLPLQVNPFTTYSHSFYFIRLLMGMSLFSRYSLGLMQGEVPIYMAYSIFQEHDQHGLHNVTQ